ncbi:MAG: hypothetical protein B5766_10280 [Candidatus Lumbricidophila eiseniae]|uniref:Uncharacterized protein n=1 Tax=Candidatus Lumbricidiphila eiseniae TaxID=1969409 RepID=A0A2A6FPG6_9MICO|nr:MAG: hypothetical protein B5766_10280 [Candidatus Lumbricidophila eiseniae]
MHDALMPSLETDTPTRSCVHSPALFTKPSRVIVALDIDGSVSPLEMPNNRHPLKELEPDWGYRWMRWLPQSLGYGSLIAEPVVRLLQDLQAAPHVDVRWHTGWWTQAWALNSRLRLPRWPMLATEGEFLRGQNSTDIRQLDWKNAAIVRTLDNLGSHEQLIWVEDEIEYFAQRDHITDLLDHYPQLIAIQPEAQVGISSRELAVIRAAARL